MYAQVLGCALMGAASEFQAAATSASSPAAWQLAYVFVTTGLCGSITTFSTWQFEANKLLLTQLDPTYGSIGSTYHGGRFLEWLLALALGYIVPLAALEGGKAAVQEWLGSAPGAAGAEALASEVDALKRAAATAPEACAVAEARDAAVVAPAPACAPEPAPASSALALDSHGAPSPAADEPLVAGGADGFTGASSVEAGLLAAGAVAAASSAALQRVEAARAAPSALLPAPTPALDAAAPGAATVVVNVLRTAGGVHAAAAAAAASALAAEPPRASLLYAAATLSAAAIMPAAAVVLSSAPPAPAPPPPPPLPASHEAAVLAAYAAATAIVVVAPAASGWASVSWACALGAAGAYARFLLAPLNKGWPALGSPRACGAAPARLAVWAGLTNGKLPVGTLAANTIGSWVLAAVMAEAKLDASYHNVAGQALLMGVATGFCGCLTTMSTFVLELSRLPRRHAYFYGALSYALAIAGWLLLFDAPAAALAARAAASAAVDGPRVSLCADFSALCAALLVHAGCAPANRTNVACGPRGPADWRGACTCGGMDGTARVSELLIDAQSRANVSQSLVPAWPVPADGGGGRDVTGSIDLCMSFQALCDSTLQRVGCPAADRVLNACGRGGMAAFRGACACGAWDVPTTRVQELIADALLFRRYALLPYAGHPSMPRPLDVCAAFVETCGQLLDGVMCPPGARRVVGCTRPGNYSTYVGACECFPGTADFSLFGVRVAEDVMDAMFKPYWFPIAAAALLTAPVAPATGPPAVYDACALWEAQCSAWLDVMGCPAALRDIAACDAADPNFPAWPAGATASIGSLASTCACGAFDVSSGRCGEWMFDAMLSADLVPRTFVPPPVAPYTLVAASSPFRPLLNPVYPLPGMAGL